MNEQVSVSAEGDRAGSWADARSAPDVFARGLLQAMTIAAPSSAAALFAARAGAVEPEPLLVAGRVDDLVRSARADALSQDEASLRPLEGDGRWMASVPCRLSDQETLLAVALIVGDHAQGRQALMRMELVGGLAETWREARAERSRHEAAEAPARALGVLSAANEQRAFFGACLSVCNAIASRWEAERVSIGFLRNGLIRLEAISNAEQIARTSELVRSIESVMEETTDQDREVACPPDAEDVVICRAAAEHLAIHDTGSCATLPLRHEGEPVGALCVEWAERSTPTFRSVEALRLTSELMTPRLLDIRARDRWIGARAWSALMDAGASLVGPRYTGTKLAALAVAGFLLFAFFVKGEDRVSAEMTLESVSRRVLPAPFDGFLATARTRAGDEVTAGDLMATLDTAELGLELAELRSERRSRLAEEAMARREGETAQAQAARAQADRAAARIELIERRIEIAEVRAPISGVVTEGDLQRMIGAPIAVGDRLFTIAPLDALRAEILIPEGRIADVAEGARGELATASFPERRIAFTVERIDPVARVVEAGNVFAARVRLDETPPWTRPGMEGVAKINAGRRAYAAIWTRDLVNWVRMKLWI